MILESTLIKSWPVTLVSDYITRDLLSGQAFNFPEKELVGNTELKSKLKQMCSGAILSAEFGKSTVDEFAAAKREFWEAVRDGPVFVCSARAIKPGFERA